MNIFNLFKSVKDNLGLHIHDLISCMKNIVFKSNVKRRMKALGIPNKRLEKEHAWKEKWESLGSTNVVYYRYNASFIGEDVNIVPVNLLSNIIEPILNPVRFRPYYMDKNMFDWILGNGYCPATLLRRVNGVYMSTDYGYVSVNDDVLPEFCKGHERIVVKPSVETAGGKGIMIFEWGDKGYTAIFSYNPDYTGEQLSANLLDKLFGHDFIIQEYAEQSSYLAKFNPKSVNTIRVCAYRSVISEEIHILGAVLRVGQKDVYIDNACYGGSFIGINRDGSLKKKSFNKEGQSGRYFGDIDYNLDYKIPDYEKVITFVKEVCRKIFHHRLIALDIMIDKNGLPKLVEFNIEYFSDYFIQTTVSSLFTEWTDEVIDYCRKNRSKRSRILFL